MSDDVVKEEIFGDFWCVHCGGVNPAEWIKSRKGKKEYGCISPFLFRSASNSPGGGRVDCKNQD